MFCVSNSAGQGPLTEDCRSARFWFGLVWFPALRFGGASRCECMRGEQRNSNVVVAHRARWDGMQQSGGVGPSRFGLQRNRKSSQKVERTPNKRTITVGGVKSRHSLVRFFLLYIPGESWCCEQQCDREGSERCHCTRFACGLCVTGSL